MNRALIALDDHITCRSLSLILMESGLEVAEAGSLAEARQHLRSTRFDLLFTAPELPDGAGASLLEGENVDWKRTVLVERAGAAPGRNGFTDHLTLPLSPAGVRGLAGSPDVRVHQEPGEADGWFDRTRLLGRSQPIREVLSRLQRMGPTRATVLISGETGTGKEVAARTLHRLSTRRDRPFVAVNCGAISPSLMESELFGHERGSFTGATRRHRGLFERADGGTLFLDEITEMPSDLQVKLLRVLEEGRIVRTGGEELIDVDVRIVASTNGDAETAIEEGRLREDLYYRLKVLHVTMPPLRDRGDDVLILAEAFLGEICAAEGRSKRFSEEAESVLLAYCWPGNVRQLRNAVHAAHLMARGEWVGPNALPEEVRQGVPDLRFFRGPIIRVPLGTPIREVERRLVLGTLSRMNGHRGRTAETLGISLKTLYNRLQSYGYGEGELGTGQGAFTGTARA